MSFISLGGPKPLKSVRPLKPTLSLTILLFLWGSVDQCPPLALCINPVYPIYLPRSLWIIPYPHFFFTLLCPCSQGLFLHPYTLAMVACLICLSLHCLLALLLPSAHWSSQTCHGNCLQLSFPAWVSHPCASHLDFPTHEANVLRVRLKWQAPKKLFLLTTPSLYQSSKGWIVTSITLPKLKWSISSSIFHLPRTLPG